MLNYIWVSLVLIGILVAAGNDIWDEATNPYRNGLPVAGIMEIRKSPTPLRDTWEGDLVISAADFNAFYGKQLAATEIRQQVVVFQAEGRPGPVQLPVGEAMPGLWKEMTKAAATKERLTGKIAAWTLGEDGRSARIGIVLEPIRFVKMKAVTQAALEYATTAVNIAIGLIGIMALWLGVMRVAEEAGMLKVLTRLLTPVTKRIFPDVPPDHPAVGAMIMNIAANMLGLSNAATPMGLKAMEELNKLNPKVGTASNAMVTFLAINTGGLILIPATAIAVRAAAGSTNPGIIIGTSIVGAGVATIAGVVASKLLQRLPRYKKAMEV
jgi:spore maturation protein A